MNKFHIVVKTEFDMMNVLLALEDKEMDETLRSDVIKKIHVIAIEEED